MCPLSGISGFGIPAVHAAQRSAVDICRPLVVTLGSWVVPNALLTISKREPRWETAGVSMRSARYRAIAVSSQPPCSAEARA